MSKSYKNVPQINPKTVEPLYAKYNTKVAYLIGKDVNGLKFQSFVFNFFKAKSFK